MVWQSSPTQTGHWGIWCCRRLDVHQRTSVLDVLSWSRLQLIHSAMSSMHADIRSWSECLTWSRNCRSVCRQRTHADEGRDVQSLAVSQLYTSPQKEDKSKDWPFGNSAYHKNGSWCWSVTADILRAAVKVRREPHQYWSSYAERYF